MIAVSVIGRLTDKATPSDHLPVRFVIGGRGHHRLGWRRMHKDLGATEVFACLFRDEFASCEALAAAKAASPQLVAEAALRAVTALGGCGQDATRIVQDIPRLRGLVVGGRVDTSAAL